MNADLSPNAQAILLLTAPLLAGRRRRPPRPRTQRGSVRAAKLRPLSTAEYRDFAKRLRAIHREPADLLGSDARETVRESLASLDAERIHRLLGRGFLLAQAVERWRARALWVVTRADPDYPRKLKARMRGNAPPVLYGCGDRTILNLGGLALRGGPCHAAQQAHLRAVGRRPCGQLGPWAWGYLVRGNRPTGQAEIRVGLRSRLRRALQRPRGPA